MNGIYFLQDPTCVRTVVCQNSNNVFQESRYKLTWILEYYDSKQIIVLNPQTLNLIERKDRDSDNVPFLKSAVVEVMEKV